VKKMIELPEGINQNLFNLQNFTMVVAGTVLMAICLLQGM